MCYNKFWLYYTYKIWNILCFHLNVVGWASLRSLLWLLLDLIVDCNGQRERYKWTLIKTNEDVVSELWIAYCLYQQVTNIWHKKYFVQWLWLFGYNFVTAMFICTSQKGSGLRCVKKCTRWTLATFLDSSCMKNVAAVAMGIAI